MKKSRKLTLPVLAGIFLLLGLSVYVSRESDSQRMAPKAQQLFSSLRGDAIQRIVLVEGERSIELALKDGVWVVPARDNYPAATDKIRSLLLKVMDLGGSQRITESASQHARLGVATDSPKNGRSRIALLDREGKELSALYLGELRRPRSATPSTASAGQYVRKEGQDAVYLVGEPLSISILPEQWIRPELLNVSEDRVLSVSQRSAANEIYALDASLPGSAREYTLRSGEPVQSSVARQVATGLENVLVSDVLKAESEKAAALKFDTESVYELSNGQRVTAASAVEGSPEVFFVRYRVEFLPELVTRAAELVEKVNAGKADTDKKLSAPTAATVDDTVKLNDSVKDWIFVLPQYQAEKYRQSKDGLLKIEKAGE